MRQLFKDTNIFALPEAEKQPIELLGNNKKGVLIVFRAQGWNQELRNFLEKILRAVQLNFEEDIHYLNITNHPSISFFQLNQNKAYRHVIAFGLAPKELGLNIESRLYQPILLSDIQWLFAHNIQDIFEERQQGKKQMAAALWKALQLMF